MIAPVDSRVTLSRAGKSQEIRLGSMLAPEAAEAAERRANAWIKSLRHARVDAEALRDRFTYRGDSLWWFGELFLHKQRTINGIYAAMAAFEALARSSPRPAGVVLNTGGAIVATIGAAVCARHGVAFEDGREQSASRVRRALATRLAPALYTAGAYLKRRRVPPAAPPDHRPRVAAFVHSAFWREATSDDTYVGPVLHALASRLDPRDFALVGVGPTSSFQRRDWRRRVGDLRESAPASLTPIEALAPADAIRESHALWTARRQNRDALLASADLRDAAVVDGYDAWPLVRQDLAGIADLQMPWSARAMDEAAAALERLQPDVAVTYAEAGGWGRALTLEARRRGIPVAGIQHGFISRHWLNYLHEPDEIAPSAANAADRGCPLVDRTLLYDEFARRHLEREGHYPPDRLEVVGNPRLDALVDAARKLTADDLARVRREVGAPEGAHLVLLAAKRIPEFDETFAALIAAVRALPGAYLVIRPHPAETAEPYERLAAGAANVRVVPLSVPAVALIAAARVVATINSTVAIEAMVLDVPALAMRLPNYLSPFVEAGVMAGATTPADVGPALAALVDDDAARARLAAARARFMDEFAMRSDGRASPRAAEAILALGTRAAAGRLVRGAADARP